MSETQESQPSPFDQLPWPRDPGHSDPENVETFAEIRAESILAEAAIIVTHFVGRGDNNKARREFMRISMAVFDRVSDDYTERTFNRHLTRVSARRRQRERDERIGRENAAAQAIAADAGKETPPPSDPTPV
jgi:hypothetical protein